MSGLRLQAQLFGLDLSRFWGELVVAWRGMLAWPIFAWLLPKFPVRLWLPDGHAVLSYGPKTPALDLKNDPRLQMARFEAVLLPEDLLLRTVVTLPQLQSQDIQNALALQVAGLSPFSVEDLVWAHEFDVSAQNGGVRVHLALTSRQLVARYIQQTHPNVNLDHAEVWLPSTLTTFALTLNGYGGSDRLRKAAVWRRVNIGLVLFALLLMGAMAATPTVQLYLRTHGARLAMATLQSKAAPVLQQREAQVRAMDRLVSLSELAGKSMPPLPVLQLITDALPDDTSLSQLQLQGLKVSLSGQTPDTTSLMKQLGARPGFRNVTAPSPAIKPLGAPRESFTIEFTLDPAQLANIK